MTHSGDQVVASVEATFPKSGWARVLDLLESYGVESYERERKRVQLAILKLSAGSEEKVREYVAVAKRDYRDVLFWAEYPEESRLDTPEKRETLAGRVKSHAQMIRSTTLHFMPLKRFTAPTPMMEVEITCVVERGMP